jgi:hypothetical protein
MMPGDGMEFICEVCGCRVLPGDKATRILAETCVIDVHGGGAKENGDQEVIFAVFHAECVASTYSARECDVIAYLSEAREVLEVAEAV